VAKRPRPRRGGNGPRDPRPLGRTTDRRSGRARRLHPMTEDKLLGDYRLVLLQEQLKEEEQRV